MRSHCNNTISIIKHSNQNKIRPGEKHGVFTYSSYWQHSKAGSFHAVGQMSVQASALLCLKSSDTVAYTGLKVNNMFSLNIKVILINMDKFFGHPVTGGHSRFLLLFKRGE